MNDLKLPTPLPTHSVKNNCVIITVRIPDPAKDKATRRTTISMHMEHFRRLAEYLGDSTWVLRIAKHIATNIRLNPGDNRSQLVWSQLEASKEKWREAIEKGAFN